jgi:hypothetical protein
VDAPRADGLRATLKEPGQAIEAKTSPARYSATVASVAKALDDAVTLVAGAGASAPAFRAKVIAALLEAVAEEYEESYKDTRITQLVEYQDAYGFFHRAKSLYTDLPPTARSADADMQALTKGFPSSREPPKPPMPAKTVKTLTTRIAATVTK